jgi:lysophospholipase L1-like esterase
VNRQTTGIVAALATALATLLFGVPGATSLAPASAAAAALPGDRALDVLVLGDSYSAGNGANGATYGPAGCYRNTTHWGEKYAVGLRARGLAVRLANHACSGGRTPDVHTPRPMDTQSGRTAPAPSGVTTTAEADAHLRAADPCNTRAFPAEEFWTYRATSVSGGTITYDCTRTLRAQADFVTADTDLVVFTMGGNDAGFSTIVQSCFVSVTRTADACRSAVETARGLVPTIRQRLIDDVAALRAHGLRADARILQLGYPWLQLDNDFVLPDPASPLTPYPAGDAVRSLITDATAQLATVPAAVNADHPGQMSFVGGVTDAFSGHEPAARTTNPQTWINEALSGADTNLWYHPNDSGQTAYAELLLAGGTWGAPTTAPTPPASTATLRVRPVHRRVPEDRAAALRVRVRLSDGSAPAGRVRVRRAGSHHLLASRRMRVAAEGRLRVRVRGLTVGRRTLVVTYRDRHADRVRQRVRVRITAR